MEDIDIAIIGLLETDARMSNAEIARRAGTTPGKVRRRIQKLVNDEVISLKGLVNAHKVGFPVPAHIGIHLDLDKIDGVATSLARMADVRTVYRTTGAEDIIIVAVFPTNEDLLTFL